jgi:hypothetical protein
MASSLHGFYWWIGEGRYLSTWAHLLCRIIDGKYANVLCVMSRATASQHLSWFSHEKLDESFPQHRVIRRDVYLAFLKNAR